MHRLKLFKKKNSFNFYYFEPMFRIGIRGGVVIGLNRYLYFAIDSWGVEFNSSGDSVIWLWPWKRREGKDRKYLSLSFWTTYRTLKEIDEEWVGYFKACDEAMQNSIKEN